MTWLYDVTALGSSAKNQVRYLIQDTDSDDPQLQDEEIAFTLVQFPAPTTGMPYMAAAVCCDALVFKYARSVQNSIGPLSEAAQQRYDHYLALASSLRVLAATGGLGNVPGAVFPATPIMGGGGNTYLGSNPYDGPVFR